jgi:hypothetical protein
MQHEDAEMRLLVGAKLDSSFLNVLLQLFHGILEGSPGVVDLVNDQDALADQVVDRAQGAEVKPLGASNLRAGLLDNVGGKALIQRQANGLDGNVGVAGLLEETTEDTGRYVTTTANGDDQLRLNVLQDLRSRLLAELVHLRKTVNR